MTLPRRLRVMVWQGTPVATTRASRTAGGRSQTEGMISMVKGSRPVSASASVAVRTRPVVGMRVVGVPLRTRVAPFRVRPAGNEPTMA